MPPVGPITIDSPSPLAADTLFFRSMVGVEALSQCFEYQVLVGSPVDLQPNDLLGVATTVNVQTADGGNTRFFNGVITSVEYLGASEHKNYRLVLRPWLWFLGAAADCRIFQNLSVVDIIKQVFTDLGFADFDDSFLSGDYAKQEYTVQYRETNLDFVSRLMEREGIYYFFEHKAGAHTLVLVDSYTAHEDPPCGALFVPFQPPVGHRSALMEYVSTWQLQSSVETGKYSHADFDFTKSRAKLFSTAKNNPGYAHDGLEVYDYPGGFTVSGAGDAYALVRLQQRQVALTEAKGATNARRIGVGYQFSLVDHPRDDQNTKYLVTAATYRLEGHDEESGSDAQGEVFECAFTAMDATTQYRPPLVHQKPTVRGPQTALVVGPSGEEIWTDEYARVKVQFHWDRLGNKDEKSSCFVRVSQAWAGPQFGSIHIPRIGQEVIVDFLEHDPDRPIITGRVYNDANMPPYTLPANATQSGIKSRSSKGGNQSNANEMRFEDRKGSEELYIQAEKDLTALVKNNETVTVKAARTVSVGTDDTLTVGNNRTSHVKVNEAHTVDSNRTVKVGADESITVSGNETQTIKGNRTETVGGNESLSVTGNDSTKITGDQSLSVTGSRDVKVIGSESILVVMGETVKIVAGRSTTIGLGDDLKLGGGLTEKMGGDRSLEVGGNNAAKVSGDDSANITGAHSITVGKTSTIKATNALKLESDEEIAIQSGSANVTLKKNGDIVIQGGGKVTVTASSDLVLKGSKISLN